MEDAETSSPFRVNVEELTLPYECECGDFPHGNDETSSSRHEMTVDGFHTAVEREVEALIAEDDRYLPPGGCDCDNGRDERQCYLAEFLRKRKFFRFG